MHGCGLCGVSCGVGAGGHGWSKRRWPCGHERDPSAPVERRLDGLTERYDERTHGPRAFGGDFVCLRCVLERQQFLLRERADEISYLVGEADVARRGAEPAMTERDVLAEQLQAALQRISHLQGQLAQVATPSHIVSLLLPVFACISRPEVTLAVPPQVGPRRRLETEWNLGELGCCVTATRLFVCVCVTGVTAAVMLLPVAQAGSARTQLLAASLPTTTPGHSPLAPEAATALSLPLKTRLSAKMYWSLDFKPRCVALRPSSVACMRGIVTPL